MSRADVGYYRIILRHAEAAAERLGERVDAALEGMDGDAHCSGWPFDHYRRAVERMTAARQEVEWRSRYPGYRR